MECVASIQNLISKDLERLSTDKLQKEVAEAIRNAVQLKGVLVTQKLAAYRSCTLLITKYNQQWKKQGEEMSEANSALVMNVFINVTEEINKITKEEKNDKLVLEASIVPSILSLM